MALGWLIAALLIIVLFMTIFKTQDLLFIFALMKKYGFLIMAIVLIFFVSFSMYHIYTAYDVDLTSFKGILKGGKLYFLWIKSLFGNFGKITGYAINQDWILNNATNVTK